MIQVHSVLGVETHECELRVVLVDSGDSSITEFAVIYDHVTIEAIARLEAEDHVSTVFKICTVETVDAVSAIHNVISCDILIVIAIVVLVHLLLLTLLFEDLSCLCNCLGTSCIQFLELLLVLVFAVLLIENAVLLAAQTEATKAVTTVFTVREEKAVAAVMCLLTLGQVVALTTIDAFYTELTLETVQTIGAVRTTIDRIAVVTIFIMIRHKDHVTVFVLLCAIGVITIDVL